MNNLLRHRQFIGWRVDFEIFGWNSVLISVFEFRVKVFNEQEIEQVIFLQENLFWLQENSLFDILNSAPYVFELFLVEITLIFSTEIIKSLESN
jgi:hypothetical protein